MMKADFKGYKNKQRSHFQTSRGFPFSPFHWLIWGLYGNLFDLVCLLSMPNTPKPISQMFKRHRGKSNHYSLWFLKEID